MYAAAILAAVAVPLCAQLAVADRPSATPGPALKDVFKDDFLVGAAISLKLPGGDDHATLELAARHFNAMTPENQFKWQFIHPAEGKYTFERADAFMALARTSGAKAFGHTLIWHNSVPDQVFVGPDGKPASRELLLARMKEHITTVVGRYRGKVHGWDVVNEALADGPDDAMFRDTKWRQIIGDDYIEKAFEYAAAADPDAELYYNDYGLADPPKRDRVVRLVKDLKAKGLRVDGVGMQGHWRLDQPSVAEAGKSIEAFAALGVHVMVTEMDIDALPRPKWSRMKSLTPEEKAEFNPYPDGAPAELLAQQARRYAELFALFVKHRDKITRVSFWGTTDAYTWLNRWPLPGRTNYPLLFDRQCQPKPAFDAVVGVKAVKPPVK